MTVIRVYRWQDAEGRGPYRPGVPQYWADDANQAKNPAFFQEFGMDIVKTVRPGETFGCGFRTTEQMRQWFNEAERQRMRLLGYRFGWLDVDRIVAESEKQLVFARRIPFARRFHVEEREAA